MEVADAEAVARACGVRPALSALQDVAMGMKVNDARLNVAVARLKTRADLGLPDPLLGKLIDLWTKSPSKPKWLGLLKWMIPEGQAGRESIGAVVRWLRVHHHKAKALNRSCALLSWLHALLEFHLLDEAYLDLHYDFFFYLLNLDRYRQWASKIVYVLSKPHDVTRARVLNLLAMSRVDKESKYNNCLFVIIELFKTFKPECVSEKVNAGGMNNVFPKVHKGMLESLQHAESRRNIQSAAAEESKLLWYSSFKNNKQRSESLIPEVEHISLGSNLYCDYLNRKNVSEFQSVKDLLAGNIQSRVDLPANILSLMINDAGMHMIMVSDENIQSRFSHALYQTLYNSFIEKSNIPKNEKRLLLRRIIKLQKYLVQGIPVVSRFLALYIASWNGEDFFSEILELLEWITFDSFEELYDCILEHVETLYLTNNNFYGCSLINMLKRLYTRLHNDMTSDRNYFFLRRRKAYNDIDVLNDLGDFIRDLCERSVNDVYRCAVLRNTFLDAYYAISKLQANCAKPMWTIMPISLTYGTLCSLSGFAIDRVFALLMNYRLIYEKIKCDTRREEINQQVLLIQNYCADCVNCLYLGQSLKLRKQGILLEAVPDQIFDYIPDKEEYDRLLQFKSHAAFAAYNYVQTPIGIDGPGIPSIFKNIRQFFDTIPINDSNSFTD